MQILCVICLFLTLLTGGSDDFFRLDESEPESDKVDLLKSSETTPDYRVSEIKTGHFLSPDEQSLMLVETYSDFTRKSQSYFRLSFANISGNTIEIVGQPIEFKGFPVKCIAGDIDNDGLDDILLEWIDWSANEIIQVVSPDGLRDSIFPPRQVPDDRNEDIAFADMDGDGVSEVVIPSLRSELSPVNEIDKIIVYFLKQDKCIIESYAILPAPLIDLVVADTNLDGKDEIITLRKIGNSSASNAIWTIMRRDDGVYIERPLAEGDLVSLVPPPPDGNYLFYLQKTPTSGHYYNNIVALKFDGDDFESPGGCRLLPEGLIFGMRWGYFTSDGLLSLAIITDESLSNRRWLTIYTPLDGDNFINKQSLIVDDNFHPVGECPLAVDLDGDNVDELLYVGENGIVYQFNIASRERIQMRIKK